MPTSDNFFSSNVEYFSGFSESFSRFQVLYGFCPKNGILDPRIPLFFFQLWLLVVHIVQSWPDLEWIFREIQECGISKRKGNLSLQFPFMWTFSHIWLSPQSGTENGGLYTVSPLQALHELNWFLWLWAVIGHCRPQPYCWLNIERLLYISTAKDHFYLKYCFLV